MRREFGARRYRNTFVTYPGRFRPNIRKITRPTAYPTIFLSLSLLGLILQYVVSLARRGERERARNRMLPIEPQDDERRPFHLSQLSRVIRVTDSGIRK